MLLIGSERDNKIMTSKYFVGIDVGTNETKGILIDEQGYEVVSASTVHGVENPKPNYFEHDADKVWYRDVCIIAQKLINQSKVDPTDIKSIGISALSSDCLPVDIEGKPLRKAILYGIDPKHKKDLRDLGKAKTITAEIILESKIRQAYISLALKKPISSITPQLIDEIHRQTGANEVTVEKYLQKNYPNGSIGAFMTSYFEMAFKGKDEAIDFEKATTEIFTSVFKYKAQHLGQTGSTSAPDILLISDEDGYQSIIDNKAYSEYSINGDHHNRMVHNYIRNIKNYSSCEYPIGYFSYIAGGFIKSIDKQIQAVASESGVNGSGITVGNFIKLIERNQIKPFSHKELRKIFGLNKQILLEDI